MSGRAHNLIREMPRSWWWLLLLSLLEKQCSNCVWNSLVFKLWSKPNWFFENSAAISRARWMAEQNREQKIVDRKISILQYRQNREICRSSFLNRHRIFGGKKAPYRCTTNAWPSWAGAWGAALLSPQPHLQSHTVSSFVISLVHKCNALQHTLQHSATHAKR